MKDEYLLPKDRATINATCRSLYHTHPIVNSIINSHSSIPTNYMDIALPEQTNAHNLFERQINSINLLSKLEDIIREYWLVGEAFVYMGLDEKTGMWSDCVIQNPDYVKVTRRAEKISYSLRPDEELRRIVQSKEESDIAATKMMNETIIGHIKNGENIPLDSFYLSHIIRRISPYEIRGSSILVPILKTLLSNDIKDDEITSEKIRECLMDPFFNDSVNMNKIQAAYRSLFVEIEQFVQKKVFDPIAKMNSLTTTPTLKFRLNDIMKDLKE